MTFSLKGHQDDVETDDTIFISEDVDLSIGQKEVKPKGKITGAYAIVGITDINKPLEIELSEAFSFDDKSYSTLIDNLSQYE